MVKTTEIYYTWDGFKLDWVPWYKKEVFTEDTDDILECDCKPDDSGSDIDYGTEILSVKLEGEDGEETIRRFRADFSTEPAQRECNEGCGGTGCDKGCRDQEEEGPPGGCFSSYDTGFQGAESRYIRTASANSITIHNTPKVKGSFSGPDRDPLWDNVRQGTSGEEPCN